MTPSSVQLGASVSVPASQLWPNAGMSSCAISTWPQTEQYFPSVFPGSVQVGATAALAVSVCPLAGITVPASSISPHTVQQVSPE